MNKKIMIISFIIILVVILGLNITKRKNINSNLKIKNSIEKINVSNIIQDENTQEYVIYDLDTQEEIARSNNKESLHIYQIDPYYNPKSLEKDDFLIMDDYE